MGERAKSIGEEAEEKIWAFIDDLGYEIQETNNEDYDLDCIAESPPETPKVGLAKPRYAPKGLVAIEVRESTVSQAKVKAFAGKIRKYNRENNPKLGGGIYLVDRRISPKMLDFMKRRRVWGWGVRRQKLYRKKADVFNLWFREQKKKKAFTVEIPIDVHTSYLRVSTLPPLRARQLLRFSVFFDNTAQKLSPKIVRRTMNWAKKKSISPLIDLGVRPMKVYFEFFSIGGLSKYLREEIYKTVIEPWSDEKIAVLVTRSPFKDYRAFTNI